MSDTAAWAYGGQQARKEYNDLRLAEVKQRSYFEKIPYFHNGVVRLGAVDTYHRIITDTLPDYDQEITRPVLRLVERAMIPAVGGTVAIEQPHSIKAELRKMLESVTRNEGEPENEDFLEPTAEEVDRFRARSLAINRTEETVQAWDETPTPHSQADETSPTRLRPPFNESVSSQNLLNTSRPQLSWLDACDYYRRKKKRLPIDKEAETVVKTLVCKLRGRDYIFLVDTSISMKPHQQSMEDLLLIHTYLVKGMDADGLVEVCYTASGESKSRRKSSAIRADFKKQPWTGLGFEDKLSDLISRMSIRLRNWHERSKVSSKSLPLPPKQSIYVLTDGRWADLEGIEDHIRRVVQTIRETGLGRTQFTIQFISFGPDLAGLERLQELDDFGRREGLEM
jgi:hypothetical protein